MYSIKATKDSQVYFQTYHGLISTSIAYRHLIAEGWEADIFDARGSLVIHKHSDEAHKMSAKH